MSLGSRAFLALTCVSVIAGTWFIFKFENAGNCIESEFVKSIEFREVVDGRDWHTSYAICGQNAQGSMRLKSSRFGLLKDKIEAFEAVMHMLSAPMEPISIEVTDDPSFQVSFQPRNLELGLSIFKAEGMFLKSLNSVWLLQTNPSLRENLVMLEVLSDIMAAVESGGLKLAQPLTGRLAQFSDSTATVPKLLSQREMCGSAWLPLTQIGLCKALQDLELVQPQNAALAGNLRDVVDRVSLGMSDYSPREFIGNELWKLYMNNALNQRIDSLKTLYSWIEKQNFAEVSIPKDSAQWPSFVKNELDKYVTVHK